MTIALISKRITIECLCIQIHGHVHSFHGTEWEYAFLAQGNLISSNSGNFWLVGVILHYLAPLAWNTHASLPVLMQPLTASRISPLTILYKSSLVLGSRACSWIYKQHSVWIWQPSTIMSNVRPVLTLHWIHKQHSMWMWQPSSIMSNVRPVLTLQFQMRLSNKVTWYWFMNYVAELVYVGQYVVGMWSIHGWYSTVCVWYVVGVWLVHNYVVG